MADRFGGATAFTREPAEGLWKEAGEAIQRDDIVIIEVMVEEIDEQWWRDYRTRLEEDFSQEHILIRATRSRIL